MKTLADFPAIAEPLRLHRDEPWDSARVWMVVAPCCGRRTAADTVVDVRDVSGTVVRAGGHQAPRDHAWLCDGCVHRLFADPHNAWTRSTLLSACGAPPERVREHHARELADAAAQADFKAGRSHRPEAAHAAALASLPVGIDPHRRRHL